MCQKSSKGSFHPLPLVLVKVLVILTFFIFAECAAGSCLSYGHACWGAHGKRNGRTPTDDLSPENKDIVDAKWFMSRLIQNPVSFRGRSLEIPISHQNAIERQLLSDGDMNPLKGQSQWDYIPEDNPLYNEIYQRQMDLKNGKKEKRSIKN